MSIVNKLKQRARFKSNSKLFTAKYTTVKKLGKEPFLMPFWEGVNKKVLASFQPEPKWNFLSNRAIIDTMFVDGDANWLKAQIAYLEKYLGDGLVEATQEDLVGEPVLIDNAKYRTSHNTIHHLYHIYYYLNKKKVDAQTIDTVVEWGGGYGNFAKLWRRSIRPDGTYVIIDTSLFCTVQWLYLSTVFSKEDVNLLTSKGAKIQKGKINIVPIAIMDTIDIKGDLFVSTWGLSESLNEAQDYVIKRKWFDCEHLLIGFQNSTPDLLYASRLGKLAEKEGAEIIDIDFIPNNHYAFK